MLTREEAERRTELLDVTGYEIDLDLTAGPDVFRVTTTIAFGCRQPGASSFVEHRARSIASVDMNGHAIASSAISDDGRISLDGLEDANELVVVAEVAYSPTPDGLCRSVDPADGEVYVFSMCFLDAAPHVFACFDQPDLKAPFTVRVVAPAGWSVRSNGSGSEVRPGHWHFETTPPLPTYLVAIVAGPWHMVVDHAGSLPLSVACRRSAAPFLDADGIFSDTKKGIDLFEDLFATPYPYTKYDQVFIPFFGLGAMENAACTTLGEDLLFRSKATDAQRSRRTEVVLHELSHMWFGDLVSVAWWDDLWLNESFATFMAYHAQAVALGDPSAWATFALNNAEGYPFDQMPTTHPIVDRIETTDEATMNFDRISYEKGAWTIRQLIAWIGDDEFRSGIGSYIAEHANRTASLADLLDALQRSSGRDLRAWASDWLHTPGPNTLRVACEVGSDDTYRSFVIEQTAPDKHPLLRRHAISLGVYDDREGGPVRRMQLGAEISGPRSAIPELVGAQVASVVVLDDANLTWAKRRLDPRSLEGLLSLGVSAIGDPVARSAAWLTLRDMTLDAELPVGAYLDATLRGIEDEAETVILDWLLRQGSHAVERLGDPGLVDRRLRLLANRCWELMRAADSGSDRQLLLARAFVRASVAPEHLDVLEDWRQREHVPPGLTMEDDDHWQIVIGLAASGRLDAAATDAERANDSSTSGQEYATTAYASIPSAKEKSRMWSVIFDQGIPRSERGAAARGFWRSKDHGIVRPFLNKVIPAVRRAWEIERLPTIAGVAHDLLATVPPEPDVVATLDDALATPDLDAPLRRVLIETAWTLERARSTRALDRRSATSA